MLDGPNLVAALEQAGITDVAWLPDTELGRWDAALSASETIRLIRVCREGEALAIAAGLHLGGRRPLVMMQCTGLFEAGDALRNVVHDLQLPLPVLVGVRSWHAYQKGESQDSCARFAEPIVRAWGIPHAWLGDLAAQLRTAHESKSPLILLMPE